MSQVHLLSSARPGDRYWTPEASRDLDFTRDAASTDRFGVHELVPDPESADIVLFVETSTCAGPYFESVRNHPTYRQHRSRCYVYCATDIIVPLVPGIFPSISREDFLPAWTRAGGYVGIRESDVFRFDPSREPTHLFSFVGSSTTHPVRRAVMRLQHADGRLLDTSRDAIPKAQYKRRYRDELLDGAFILCPRGGGPSTFRLMEAMIMGRAPVIISDAWCAPSGPDWSQFAIQVAERDVDQIPQVLEAHRSRAAEMGRMARETWLDWFGPETAFHHIVESALELHELSEARTGKKRLRPWAKAARPYHALRWAKHRMIG